MIFTIRMDSDNYPYKLLNNNLFRNKSVISLSQIDIE